MALPPRLRESVPLAPLTTFEIGGPARFFCEAETEKDVAEALAFAKAKGLPVVVLGGGSNLVVADRGFDGLVLRLALRGIENLGEGRLRVAAGEPLDDLVELAVARGWQGIECLSGIPGTVGATPIQNVGAYGQEVAESIASVRVLDRETLTTTELSPGACGFGYRSSVFKGEAHDRYVVLSVDFALRPRATPSIRYEELRRHLAARGIEAPGLREVREAVLSLRRAKSMVVEPDDPNRRSAGSFFVNPVVAKEQADAIEASVGEPMPRYPAGEKVKVPAAWLIERAGFSRGCGEGNVGLSTRHALAIVNRGGATASELLAFARRIQDAVRERFGVRLNAEPRLVGFERHEIESFVDS